MDYQDFIEFRPEKRFGRPCLKGTRISVYDVLNWLANGMSKEEILSDFEELNEEMINACIAFGTSHPDKEQQPKDDSWKQLFGAWESDQSAEEIINDIRESRVNKRDIEDLD